MPDIEVNYDDTLYRAIRPVQASRLKRDEDGILVLNKVGEYIYETYDTFHVYGPYSSISALKSKLTRSRSNILDHDITVQEITGWKDIDVTAQV